MCDKDDAGFIHRDHETTSDCADSRHRPTPGCSDLHVANHNPATPLPNSRPNCAHEWQWDKNQEGMGMIEQPYNAAQEREEIAARVASFKATQEKFEREREEYFVTTLKNARSGSRSGLLPVLS